MGKHIEFKEEVYGFNTPYGKMSIEYKALPVSVTQVCLPGNRKDKGSGKITRPPELIMGVVRLIGDYFAGKPIDIPWTILDMSGLTPLQELVLRETARIPYGSVQTYKEIAERIQRPKAARFVGNTMAINPFPIIIPCHRVIRTGGDIGKYGGGTDLKRRLIDSEKRSAP